MTDIYNKLPKSTVRSVTVHYVALPVIFFCMNYFSAKSKSPELQYPSLKFEDVGGNEETLTVSIFNLCYLMDVPIFLLL